MSRKFIAPNATVVGDVELAEEVTVWYQAVIRGDSNSVKIGARTNIQDGTVIHVDHDAPVEISEDVTVGHQCMLLCSRDCTRIKLSLSSTFKFE